jgi:hypothetical protein
MSKKSYPLPNQTLNILTPPNSTYDNKEIPLVLTTTEGVFVQSGRSIKIYNSKAQTKSKKPKM